jgi:hypothetical protein
MVTADDAAKPGAVPSCSHLLPVVSAASAFARRAQVGGAPVILLSEVVVQNHVEQRFMNPDPLVVLDKAQLAEAIHEEADTRPGGADHVCQRFLGDLRDE